MNIGAAIIEIRKSQNISQERLACDAEISRHYMYRIENNKANPTINTLEKISKILGTNVSEIIRKAESIN